MRAYQRFLQYVAVHTTSNENSETCPSTEGQRVLGQMLVREMQDMGMTDAGMDADGYVYGHIPATEGMEDQPSIGLIAHMDVSPSCAGEKIHPQILHHYDGGTICLHPEKKIFMSPQEFDSLLAYVGQDLIVTDGTTLLGADDKAGIAEILTAAEQIIKSDLPHGKICIGFTPDEEIGRGADRFNIPGFGADFAYTVDGGALGEIEYENFNAAAAVIEVHGVNIHPGSAKGKMKNALLIGMQFHSMLPVFENPAYTQGYEGFYHLCGMEGDEEKAVLHYIIRDHDSGKFAEKKNRIQQIAAYLNDLFGENTIAVQIKDSYYNMKEKIMPRLEIVKRAEQAMQACGVVPRIVPIRGGTDGARLSYEGLPCPNLSTGGHNFHGRFEYIPVQSMDRMVDVLCQLVTAQDKSR
ncbi:MAG TPA: peptidase T [Firmicutes bacterium]|nr:peptidase T [Bacillota bacterium]